MHRPIAAAVMPGRDVDSFDGKLPLVSTRDADVVVLGGLPPPVTGSAKNTLLMVEDLASRGFRTAALSTAVASGGLALARSVSYHLKRLRAFLRTAVALRQGGANRQDRPALYMVPDGGYGIIYSAAHIKLAHARYSRVVLHHRTFRYIDVPTRWMRSICRDLDKKVTHVFLSEGMRQRFQSSYGIQPALVVGNARYVRPLACSKPRDALILGHLSNLSSVKGFHECVETFEVLHAKGLPIKLVLAGPVVEDTIAPALNELLTRYPGSVEHLGPVHGEMKEEFYRRIHVFLFPTKWAQEAQPNVVYEAFAGGASVVAYGRACISEMIPTHLGLAIPPDSDFVAGAVSYIEALWRDFHSSPPSLGDFHAEVKEQARIAQAQHELLLATLTDGN